MSSFQRKDERFRVALSVRYGSARDYVRDYAENLSRGGLFINGAHNLQLGSRVRIELDLPGFDTFMVSAEVAHVIDPASAARLGRKPGAGLSIVQTPSGFAEAMHSYLLRLGLRRDHLVFVGDSTIRELFDLAGFQVRPLPPPISLRADIERCPVPVVGVIVTRAQFGPFVAAATVAKLSDLVHEIDYPEEFEHVLRIIDQRIAE